MATLTTIDRAAVHADFMRTANTHQETFPGLLKADLLAAINAVDDWVNTNAAAFSSALPLPARTALTAAQKARLLVWVVQQRYLSGV